MPEYKDFWEVERIGIVIACACVVMILVNRLHRYFPCLKCWKKDAEHHDEEQRTVRYIPDSIERLESMTKFSRHELKSMYRNFKNECPNGVISEETFKSIFAQFFPAGDAELYSRFVFKAFDTTDDGHITFEKFVVILSSLLRGTLQERLDWTFRLYDTNRDGLITKEEVGELVTSVYMLLGSYTDRQLTEEDCEAHTERVFNRLAGKEKDEIDFDQFCKVCSEDEMILKSIEVFRDHA